MSYIYVLRSIKTGKSYVGSSRFAPNKRIVAHNSGRVRSTKSGRPWELVHSEIFQNYTEARKREIFLKSGVGRKELKNIMEGCQSGRMRRS